MNWCWSITHEDSVFFNPTCYFQLQCDVGSHDPDLSADIYSRMSLCVTSSVLFLQRCSGSAVCVIFRFVIFISVTELIAFCMKASVAWTANALFSAQAQRFRLLSLSFIPHWSIRHSCLKNTSVTLFSQCANINNMLLFAKMICSNNAVFCHFTHSSLHNAQHKANIGSKIVGGVGCSIEDAVH